MKARTVCDVLLVVRGLTVGGAQRQVVSQARGLAARGRRVAILTWYPDGPLSDEVADSGIAVHSVDKRGRWDMVRPALRAVVVMRSLRPAVVYGFLPDANLVALLARHLRPRPRILWGLRASMVDDLGGGRLARAVFGATVRLQFLADGLVANSAAAAGFHRARGFASDRIQVVPNGFDLDRFRPDPMARMARRAEWQVGPDDVVIGTVGRLHPMKDHRTFFLAAKHYRNDHRQAWFVVVGDGPAGIRRELEAFSSELGLGDSVRWLGERRSLATVYPGFDLLAVSSSHGEGFPNVIGEAMASGIPCVVTAVGDSAEIVADTGLVVLPGDPESMARAWAKVLERPRPSPRSRIAACYSLDRCLDQLEPILGFDRGSA